MTKRVVAYLGLTLVTAVLAVIDFCSDMWLTNAEDAHAWDINYSIVIGAWMLVTVCFLLGDDDV